jgi:hypothetical protein
MDPNLLVSLGLTAIDEVINMIKHVKEQSGMTTDQIVAAADAQDLQNKEDIKALLTL